ncbi:hypothetical protein Trydic_g12350 [Trypoxylus dichotomus]
MSKLTALVLFLVVNAITLPTQSLVDHESGRAASFRIMGGTIAENGAYPFMASLRTHPPPNLHFCGGSIINILWVATAAHCMLGRNASSIKVVVGTNMLDSGGIAVRVQRIVTHPDFMDTTLKPNDIAMIKLASALRYSSTIGPVVAAVDPEFAINVTMIGWGVTTARGRVLSNRLRQYSTQPITQAECTRYWNGVTANQICTKLKKGKGACLGDYGGPLIDSDTKMQVGIMSFSARRVCGIAPDVYTKVSEYIDWMESIFSSEN